MAKFVTRRRASEESSSGVGPSLRDREFVKSYPALHEFLTLQAWEDGEVRVTGTLFLFVEEGMWKLCLNDRDAGCVAFVAAKTFTEVLSCAEEKYIADSLDWRLSKESRSKKKGK